MASLGAVVLLTASTKPVDFGPNQSTSLPDRETTVDNEKHLIDLRCLTRTGRLAKKLEC